MIHKLLELLRQTLEIFTDNTHLKLADSNGKRAVTPRLSSRPLGKRGIEVRTWFRNFAARMWRAAVDFVEAVRDNGRVMQVQSRRVFP
jgi:hypothetical protein